MNEVQNPMLAPNKKVAVIFYVIMYLLGSSFVLMFIAQIYTKNNPTINYEELFMYLADSTDLINAPAAMKQAYAIVSSLGNMLAYVIMLLVVGFYMRDCIVADAIGFKENKEKNIIYIFVATIIFYVITYVVDAYIIGPLVGESNNQEAIILMIQNGGALPMFIAVVICAPIVEELIYRKAIFALLEKKHIVFSYFLSIICFTLPHMLSTSFEDPVRWLLLCIPYVVSALLFAIIYHKSNKNIYSTWFIHMVNNLLSFVLIVLFY